MRQEVKVDNIKCGGCATTIRKKIGTLAQGVEVAVEEGTVTFEGDGLLREQVVKALYQLGYPEQGRDLSFLGASGAKAKSFVSCALGRLSSDPE
jgi:copper chaperone